MTQRRVRIKDDHIEVNVEPSPLRPPHNAQEHISS